MSRWTEDLAAWAASLRFSVFTVIIVVLAIAGALILSPTISTFVQQRREIAELRASVAEHREAVDEIDAEREKWKDPVYIRAEARNRLFYVLPGETQLNVIEDVQLEPDSTEETNAELEEIDENWATGLASSFLVAGTTDASVSEIAREAEE